MHKFVLVSIFFLTHVTTMYCLPLKVLHLSLHDGCVNDFAATAEYLGLNLTTWRIAGPTISRIFFDGSSKGNDVYNISHDRACAIWQRHKDFFETFDVIITSDTAPLSRIFLQHGWKKPLIIWICNRFDYCDVHTHDKTFPDDEYYDLFRQATCMPNVKIISYTPYEHVYARRRGVEIGTQTIRPLGTQQCGTPSGWRSWIPQKVNKAQTLFLFPRLEKPQVTYIQRQCSARGIKTYCDVYNGPDDLTDFKAVLYFPYAWSNLALFENIQRGIVHFVPSKKFILDAVAQREKVRFLPMDSTNDFELCDWYCPEFKDLFIYFHSWDDLRAKVAATNYKSMSRKIKNAGQEHRQNMLKKWQDVFVEIEKIIVR